MTALSNLRQAASAPISNHDLHGCYSFLIDLEARTEINLAICQNREVLGRHQRDMRLTQILIDIVGGMLDQRGECRAESKKREYRSRARAELMERLK